MQRLKRSCDPTKTGSLTEALKDRFGTPGNIIGQFVERLGGIGSLVIIALVAYSAFTGTPIHGVEGVAGYGNEQGINAVVAALAGYWLSSNGGE